MQLHSSQKKVAKDRHRFRVICCGRRWGKTTEAAYEIAGKAVSKKDQAVVYIAPTYGQARDIAWKQLVKVLQPVTLGANESRLEITVKTQQAGGASTIYLRGWESVETLRGQRFDLIVLDEVAMMRHFQECWQEILRPTLTDTRGDAMFISTPAGFNHFYDLYNLETTDPDFKSFHFTTYDNPFIPADEIEKAKKQLTTDRFSQEYLADFRKTSGLVYKEFDRQRHLVKELPVQRYDCSLLGVDFGYTNPTCLLFIKRDYDNRYWVAEEWYKTGQTNDQVARKALAFKPNNVFPDPEAPEKIRELEEAGLNCVEVNKGKDSVVNGISKVRELFKQNRLFVHQSCVNLLWELESYHYDDDHQGEVPIAEDNHAVDALRYVISSDLKEARNCKTILSYSTADDLFNAI